MSRTRYIMGKHCLEEVLKEAPHRIHKVWTSHHSSDDPLYKQLVQQGIKLLVLSKQELTKLVESESHQSYVALVEELPSLDLEAYFQQFSSQTTALVLLLDSIFDPQNFGAILRAAECFGADLVVYSKNRGTEVTPVVCKASAGATELVPLLRVSNLVETIKRFQKEGFWAVSCEVGERSESLMAFTFPEKTLLVLGSEGKGVQPLISKTSDFHVYIPMQGKIDSLNVSQAAAVFLSYYSRTYN